MTHNSISAHNIIFSDNTAILQIIGPILSHKNALSGLLNTSTIDVLTTSLQFVFESIDINAVLICIDSSGGTVSGVNELAEIIYASRGKKPMIAYVSGLCASAAYWIASACDEIVIDETASLGSIGVVSRIYDDTERMRKEGISEISIVSSQSPQKRLDIKTEEGRAQIQQQVDQIAEVFVEKVARNRNVSIEKVLTDFGQGGLLVGKYAVQAGLADRLGSLDQLIKQYSNNPQRKIYMSDDITSQAMIGSDTISLEAVTQNHPSIAQALRSEGALHERERIQSVEAQLIIGHEALIAKLKFDGKTTGSEAAIKVLAAEKEKQSIQLSEFKNELSAPLPLSSSMRESSQPVSTQNLSAFDKCQLEWQRDGKLQAEFGTFETYMAYQKANSQGQIKVLSQMATNHSS